MGDRETRVLSDSAPGPLPSVLSGDGLLLNKNTPVQAVEKHKPKGIELEGDPSPTFMGDSRMAKQQGQST